MPNAVMVFAAGFGTRMGVLTQNQPKPMIPISGTPLIDHALNLVPQGCKAVVNTHYLHEQLAEHLKGREDVSVVHEPEIFETGGGLKNALPLLGSDPVWTLNSDAIWTGENPLIALQNAWQPEHMDALLMLIPRENAKEHTGLGDFDMDQAGRLTRRKSEASADFVYTGAQIVKTDGLDKIPKTAFSLNILWNEMLAQNRVYGLVHSGGWVDVGRPEGINIAEQLLSRTQYV